MTKTHWYTLHKKWSFTLRIFSVNVTKSLMENFIFCAVRELVTWIVFLKLSKAFKYGISCISKGFRKPFVSQTLLEALYFSTLQILKKLISTASVSYKKPDSILLLSLTIWVVNFDWNLFRKWKAFLLCQ